MFRSLSISDTAFDGNAVSFEGGAFSLLYCNPTVAKSTFTKNM